MEPAREREIGRPATSPAPIAPFRDRTYYLVGSSVCEVDRIIVRADQWSRLPESIDPNWTIIRLDGYVFASRFIA